MTADETPHLPETEDGLEQCVRCGVTFGDEDVDGPITTELNLSHGPVVAVESGTEFEAVVDTEPGSRCVHTSCWDEILADRRREENESLARWTQ